MLEGIMKESRIYRFWLALLLVGSLLVSGGSAADKREIIRRAQGSYYNLPRQGCLEFQAAAVVNWSAILSAELKSDIAPDHPALKMLNGPHFWLALDEKGAAKVTHQKDVTPANEQSMENLNQTISGVEEVLSGFSQTMAPFLFTSPFPPVESDYDLEEEGDHYKISYREGGFEILNFMTRNLTITELRVSGPNLKASVKPHNTKTEKGYLVTGYEATYQSATGKDSYQVSVKIDYKEVDGLQLPGKLVVDATASGSSHRMELQFADYQVKKR